MAIPWNCMVVVGGGTQVKGMFDVGLQRTVCPGRGLRYIREEENHIVSICSVVHFER